MNKQSNTQSNRRNTAVVLLSAAIAAASPALAAAPAYTGANTGNWNTATNWSTSAVPVNGDTVSIGAFSPTRSGQTITVTFNATNLSGTGLSSLTLDSVNCQVEDLLLNGSGGALIANTEIIGNNITLNQVDHSAGTNTVVNLTIANNATSTGTYNLSGTGTLNATVLTVGNAGSGLFNQSGGTSTLSNALVLGALSNNSSTYTLSNGTLNAAAEITAENGTGAGVVDAFIQSGGNNTITGVGGLTVGQNGNGTYSLSNGTLNVTGAAAETLGFSSVGHGTFTQSNGTNNASNLQIGSSSSITGSSSYNLQGGNLTTTSGSQIIGNGTLTQTGGTNTLNSSFLEIGDITAVTGSYSLQGGNLTTNSSSEYIGFAGPGTFTQTNGVNFLNFNSALYVGGSSTSTGNYSLQGGSLSISIGSEYIGYLGGTGTLTQSGNATNTLSNASAPLYIGYGSGGSNGTYNLQAGNLTVLGQEIIADFSGSFGTFNQSNGNHTVGGSFVLGQDGTASYTLSNGTLTVTGEEFIAEQGTTSTFTQSGGVNNALGSFDIAEEQGDPSTGTYTLTGGTLNVLNGGSETVGDDGTGSFQQSGGLNNVTGTFFVGSAAGSISGETDTYNLSGNGTLTVAGAELIGSGTFGNFNQTGGINNANGAAGLTVGGAGFPSTYALSNGTLNTANLTVSYSGNLTISGGLANLSTGNLTIIAPLVLGASTFTGTVDLTGGTLNVSAINVNGVPSDFQWTGGTLGLTSGITFDPNASPTSTSATFGGNLTLNSGMNLVVTGSETIGGLGFFKLTLNTGSTDTATGALTVASTGTLVQNGAPISQNLLNLGTFIYNGGTFTGQLTNSSSGFGSGFATFNLSGTFSNGLINSGIVAPVGLGVTLTLNGAGLNNSGSLTLAGGSLNATTATNSGLISGYGFIQASPFANSGTITQTTGNLIINSLTTGFNNTGTVNLASGLQLQISGAAATNDGFINLNGGTINMGPILTNASDGTINGPGKIIGVFVNNGTLAAPAGNFNDSFGFTNTGLITLSSPAALFTGGAISSNGTIQGTGTIAAQVIDTGAIEAVGGTLTFTGPVSDTAGTLRTSPGTKILMQGASSFPINTGLIDLAGGTFDNGNHTLNNTGAIVGFGVLSTGGLTNNGNFTLTGGTATVNGNVTNASPQFINIKFQPALFTGNVTNNVGATIKTTNTTATFAAAFNNNGSFISDPSTNIFQFSVNNAGSMTGGVGDVYNLSGGSFTNSGSFTNGGTLQSSDNTTNSGTFTQSGPQIWSNGTTFTNTAGTATFFTDTGSATASPLNINVTGGLVNLSATQHLNSLTITTGKAAITTSTTKTNSLTLGGSTNNWTGTLDLGANKLIVEATALTKAAALNTLQNQAFFGSAHTTGITSAVLPAHTALAVIDNGALATPFTIFGGLPVDTNSILLAPELLGDANIDGHVNLTDLSTVLNNFGTASTSWTTGNFDGSPNIDLTDLSDVLNNFGLSYANSSNSLPSGGGATPTPEPASLALLFPLLPSLLKRGPFRKPPTKT